MHVNGEDVYDVKWVKHLSLMVINLGLNLYLGLEWELPTLAGEVNQRQTGNFFRGVKKSFPRIFFKVLC